MKTIRRIGIASGLFLLFTGAAVFTQWLSANVTISLPHLTSLQGIKLGLAGFVFFAIIGLGGAFLISRRRI